MKKIPGIINTYTIQKNINVFKSNTVYFLKFKILQKHNKFKINSFAPFKHHCFIFYNTEKEIINKQKNLVEDEIVICMGAGSISNWIREISLKLK